MPIKNDGTPGRVIDPSKLRSLGEVGGGLRELFAGVEDMEVDNTGSGRLLRGLGEDMERAADRILTRPTTKEVLDRLDSPDKKLPPLVSRPAPSKATVPGGIQTVNALEVIPNDVVVSNYIVQAVAQRIDIGPEGRTDILIANMAPVPLWINVVQNVAIGANYIGIPLKAVSGVNQFDGGVFRSRCKNTVRWWGVCTAPGVTNLVVVVESSIR